MKVYDERQQAVRQFMKPKKEEDHSKLLKVRK